MGELLVLTPPSTRLTGEGGAYWTPRELEGCPHGTVVCAVCPENIPHAVFRGLHPAEQEHTAILEGHRRREWIAGRLCLANALDRLSAARIPLLPLASGAPTVPHGFAGSISHKGPLTVALAAMTLGGVGIDVECAEASDERLAKRVLTDGERAALGSVDDSDVALFVAAHFAVKEAIYKAMSAAEQPGIDFEQIDLLAPPEKLLTPDEWVAVAARLPGCEYRIRAAVFVDEKWVIAVACREGTSCVLIHPVSL